MTLYVDTPWTTIIPLDQFLRVQDVLMSRKNPHVDSGRSDSLLLTQRAYCTCGEPLVVNHNQGNRKLFCRQRRKLKTCTEPGVSLATVERAVLIEFKKLICDGELDAEFAAMVTAEAHARAQERAETRRTLEAERDTVTRLIDEKMAATIPEDLSLKEAWDRVMLQLAARKRTAERELTLLMAKVPVTSLAGARLTKLKEQIDKLIDIVPLVDEDDEQQIRARALLRSIIKRVDLVRHDDTRGEIRMVLDFNDEYDLDQDPRARLVRTVQMHLGTSRQQERERIGQMVASGERRPTPKQFDTMDASKLIQRGIKSERSRDFRERLYHAIFLAGTTGAALHVICKKLDLPAATLSNFMRELRGPGDVEAIGKLVTSLRPDLVYDPKRLSGYRYKIHRNFARRFQIAEHPLLRHPLASNAPPEARLGDDEARAMLEALRPASYWAKRPEKFRKNIDGLLYLLRTGCSLEKLPLDLYPLQVKSRYFDLLASEDLRLATKALLVHAGLLSPGEKLIFATIPNYTNVTSVFDTMKKKKWN